MTPTRRILRDTTAAAHGRLDRAFEDVDLATRGGLGRFLKMQAAALAALEPLMRSMAKPPPVQLPFALADLAALGFEAPQPVTLNETLPDPVGIAYVIAGSHFGGRVLRGRWMTSTDPVVKRAGRFLTAQDMAQYWPVFSTRYLQADQDDDTLGNWVRGANATFACFAGALPK